MFLVRFASDVTSDHSATLPPAGHTELLERLVEQEVRRDHALRGADMQSARLAFDLSRIGFQSRQIRVGIRRRFHRMAACRAGSEFPGKRRCFERPRKARSDTTSSDSGWRHRHKETRSLRWRTHATVRITSTSIRVASLELRSIDGLQPLQALRDPLGDRCAGPRPSDRSASLSTVARGPVSIPKPVGGFRIVDQQFFRQLGERVLSAAWSAPDSTVA